MMDCALRVVAIIFVMTGMCIGPCQCDGYADESVLAPYYNKNAEQIFGYLSESTAATRFSSQQAEWRDERMCGLLALYGLLSIDGEYRSLDAIERVLEIEDRGSSLQHLKEAGEALGVPLKVVRHRSSDLEDLQAPAILHLSGPVTGHYVIYLGLDDETAQACIADFTNGRIVRWTRGDLLRSWSLFSLSRVRAVDRWRTIMMLVSGVLVLFFSVAVVRARRRRNVDAKA